MSPSHDYSPIAFADQGLIIAASQLGNEEHRARTRIALQQRRERLKAERERADKQRTAKHLKRILAGLLQPEAHSLST